MHQVRKRDLPLPFFGAGDDALLSRENYNAKRRFTAGLHAIGFSLKKASGAVFSESG